MLNRASRYISRSISKFPKLSPPTQLRIPNKSQFSLFDASTRDLSMLESYTQGMVCVQNDDWKQALIKFTETAEIFENLGTENLRVAQSLYYIKQKQLLSLYQLRKFDYCLQVLREINQLNQTLANFVPINSRTWKSRNARF